jgi:exosortase/archaeosortase family protein
MYTLHTQARTYILAFFVLFAVLYALYRGLDAYLPAYYAALAESVCWFFAWFDPAVGCRDNYLLYRGVQELVVVDGCDGITFVALLIAAVLPFPVSWRARLIGLAWLIPALLFVNWLRLIILAAVRFYAAGAFDLVHVYLFQPLMIAFTLVAFLLWVESANASTQRAHA